MLDISPGAEAVLMVDLGVLLGVSALVRCLDPLRAADRALFGGVTGVLILAYAAWRCAETVPRFDLTFGSLWQHVYLAFEAVAVIYTLLSIVILLRYADHSAEADAAEAELEASRRWPAVDVFICTYNEPVDVLEKSVLLARAMDYPAPGCGCSTIRGALGSRTIVPSSASAT